MWVLLIEKAYAKLHGNYFTLRGGYCSDALEDLTGCPAETIELGDKETLEFIRTGKLFLKLKQHEKNELMSISMPGEEMWADHTKV